MFIFLSIIFVGCPSRLSCKKIGGLLSIFSLLKNCIVWTYNWKASYVILGSCWLLQLCAFQWCYVVGLGDLRWVLPGFGVFQDMFGKLEGFISSIMSKEGVYILSWTVVPGRFICEVLEKCFYSETSTFGFLVKCKNIHVIVTNYI